MTTAEFIAACFWPLAGLFALLLTGVKDEGLRRYVSKAAAGVALLYFGLWILYPQSSIAAMVDFYIFAGLLGLAGIGYGYVRWRQDRYYGLPVASKETLAIVCAVLGGPLLAGWAANHAVFRFCATPPGSGGTRGECAERGRRSAAYLVDIAGRTVKATAPDSERLKLTPYARVEVGRGSNYIFGIEYLAN